MNINDIKKLIAEFPDFPKGGVSFKDISPLLDRPEFFELAVDEMCKAARGLDFNKILVIESRGFIFWFGYCLQTTEEFNNVPKAGKTSG